jgi:hypothetical protein
MSMNMLSRARAGASLLVVGLVSLGAVAGIASAQDATQTPTVVTTHPSHVHNGTCANLDPNPAYPLDNVGPRTDDDGNPPSTDDIKGSLTSNPVETAETTIDVKLDDLLDTAHALNVHESDQNMSNYIACGDIGGPVLDDKLFIGLQQQNDSGYSGVAILEKDGDSTKVTVYLTYDSGQPAGSGTPAA